MNQDNMKLGETIKIWNVDLDGKSQTFRLEFQWWTGEKKYYINDELIEHVKGGLLQSASFGKDVPFNVGTHEGIFKFRAVARAVFFDLVIDGNKIKGEEKKAFQCPIWVGVLLLLVLLAVELLPE